MEHEKEHIVFNGSLRSTDLEVPYFANRAFQYGDGVFESVRVVNGKPWFLQGHLQRMNEGLQKLKIDSGDALNAAKIESEITDLLAAKGISKGGRMRITAFRERGGFYTPESDQVSYIIQAAPYEDNEYCINREGITVDLYPDIKKNYSPLTPYKTLNTQVYIMAALWAKEKGMDDALLQNDSFGVLESTNSNLFIVCNGVLYTPAITDGCLAGTMRMQIINLAIENEIKVYECGITPQNLLTADEVFLTNAVRGIQWVGSYKTKRYFNTIARKLVDMLNRKILTSEPQEV